MNFEDLEVKVNKPYPEIVNAKDDTKTVAILKNLVSSRVGEMTAVTQYIYQSVIADKTNEEIAEIFEEISIVEMIHLDMLMHAITMFGGIPKYEDSQGNFFNTSSLTLFTNNSSLSTSLDNSIIFLKNCNLSSIADCIIDLPFSLYDQ